MRKFGTIPAVLGLAVLFAGGSALAATSSARHTVDSGSMSLRYTKALNLLENKGYVGFTDFHRVGDQFQATVQKDGKTMTVMADPTDGTVTANP